MAERRYTSGVEKALFMLSRGRCYEPACQQPVMRIINGEPMVNVHIAHICPHDDNGPRCADKISKEERRSFRNLILLCKPHHTVVDRKRDEEKYPESLLRGWKEQREGDFSVQLAGLDNITEDKLQHMMASAVCSTNLIITQAINELAGISQEAAVVLRTLKAETFERPYLDLDAVASLAESAWILRNLEDNASTIQDAAWRLSNLEDNANTLYSAAQQLTNLEAHAGVLLTAASEMKSAASEATITRWDSPAEDVKAAVEELSARVTGATMTPSLSTGYRSSNQQSWLYFKWGLGVGAAIVVAIVVAIFVMTHNTHKTALGAGGRSAVDGVASHRQASARRMPSL